MFSLSQGTRLRARPNPSLKLTRYGVQLSLNVRPTVI
jgi:hypothetical protein